ncbi:MAG: DUF2059 domain-containing protein [Psychrobacter sp.]|nr:DUF2059 domain-containing protein [Psychrobacter sp.]
MRLFHKTLLAGATLSTALFISGCDRGNNADNANTAAADSAASPATSEVATVDKAPTVAPAPAAVATSTNVTAEAILQQVMGSLASAFEMANQMSAEQNNGQKKFSKEQVECFVTKDNDMAVKDIQAYLEKSFSKEEIAEMDAFYQSSAGKKQIEMTQKLIDSLMGGEQFDIASMEKDMSQEEIAAVSRFWESATGKKLQQALNDKEALGPSIAPFIKAKQEHCDMPK